MMTFEALIKQQTMELKVVFESNDAYKSEFFLIIQVLI